MAVQRVAALVLGLLVFAGTATVASASPTEESEFVALINQSRGAAGLTPLTVHGDLVAGARNHTAEMIPTGSIFHSTSAQLSSVTSGWAVLGENVGKGPNPSVLHRAFLESPSHRANILGDFDKVGVGVAHDDGGVLYVTVMFMKSAAPAPTTTTTSPPATTAPSPTVTTQAPTTTTTVPAPAPPPSRPSASAVQRESVLPRTLAFDLGRETRWVAGTFCVVVRADGAICVD